MPETTTLTDAAPDTIKPGLGTYFGIFSAVAAAVAGIIAAIEENDVATAGASAAAVVAIFETLNGRFSQAVARIRNAAGKADPWIDEAQSRMAAKRAPEGTSLHRPEG